MNEQKPINEPSWVDLVTDNNAKPAIAEEPKDKAKRLANKFEGHLEVTPSVLASNIGKLNENLGRVSGIPEKVINSAEGQEQTISLKEKIGNKIREFSKGLTEKLAKLDDWKAKDTFFKYTAGAGFAMMVGPALIQYARSQYPEVGVLLDSAPDAVQQIIHFDAWAHIGNLFTGDSAETMWKGGTIEAGNLLADVSSGKVDFSTLSGDQMEMLKGSIGDTVDTIKFFADKGNTEVVSSLARGSSVTAGILKGSFGNAPLFAAVAMTTGALAGKIGTMAKNRLQTVNQ
jgi:hypothetical protein